MRSCVVCLCLLPGLAAAQDADPFRVAGSLATGQGSLQGESATVETEGFHGGLGFSFAQNLVSQTGADGVTTPALETAFPLTAHGAYAFRDGVARIDLFVPVYGWVNAPLQDFQGPAFGNLRMQGTIPLYQRSDSFNIAVIPRIELPTGQANALVRRGFSGGLTAALGGDVDTLPLGWVANLGVQLAPATDILDARLGSTADAVVGGWWQATDSFRAGVETDVSLALIGSDQGPNHRSTAHVFAQQQLDSGLSLTLGAGTGLLGGLGAPEYRMFASISWAKSGRDTDRDGLFDAVDACLMEAEDLDGFSDEDGCPDVDNDQDGLLDTADQCPNEAEDLDEFQDADGCPDLDNDGDGFTDTEDECPLLASRDNNGCPDQDRDGLIDPEDRCPDQAGEIALGGCPDTDRDGVDDQRDQCINDKRPSDQSVEYSDGCPATIYVAGNIIKSEPINFDRRQQLTDEAKEVLDQVAKLLRTNDTLKRVEVGSHTSNEGDDARNLRRTEERAATVKTYLVSQQVSDDRIQTKGYGETQPIASNRIPTGRARNERIEFIIRDQDPIVLDLGPTPEQRAAYTAPVIEPTSVAPAAAGPGALTVVIEGGRWADVYIDGTKLSQSAPFSNFEVESGARDIRVVNRRSGIEYTATIQVPAGGVFELSLDSSGKPVTPDEPESSNLWGGDVNSDGSPWGTQSDETEPSPWGNEED